VAVGVITSVGVPATFTAWVAVMVPPTVGAALVVMLNPWMKSAVTAFAPSMVIEQAPVPVHAPVQKSSREVGVVTPVGVRVTVEPTSKPAVQFTPPAGPQLAMPAGVLAIVPVPVLGGTVTVVATVTARGNCAVPLRLTVTGGTTVAPTTVVVGVRV